MGKINMATSTINTLLTLIQEAFNARVLKIENGGTGASSLNNLRSNLGLGNNVSNPLAPEFGGTGVTSLSALKGAILADGGSAIGVAQGGTGLTNLTNNAVLCGNGTNSVNMISPPQNTGTGVLQVTAANTAPTFGVVPIALGGTGVNTKSLLSNLLGLGGATESGASTVYDAIPVARGGTGQKTLNDLSNSMGLGATTTTAIPISRGGTGKTNLIDIKNSFGYLSNAGDNATGNYLFDGNISIKNTNASVAQYNLSDRLAQIESRLQALEAK